MLEIVALTMHAAAVMDEARGASNTRLMQRIGVEGHPPLPGVDDATDDAAKHGAVPA